MAKLPTREALGALPMRRGGNIASIRDFRPQAAASAAAVMGQGAQNLARGVASVGRAAEAIQEHQDRQELFETERRFQEFEWNQELGLDKSMREVKPGEVGGFAARSTEGYGENAKAFLATVPDKFKHVYDEKLFRVERSNFGAAATFERTEQKRASLSSIDDQMQTVWQPRAASSSSDELPQVQADFEKLVRVNPHLTPIEAEEVVKKGRKAIALSHVYGLIDKNPSEAERRLGDDNDPISGVLTPEQRLNLRDRAQRKIETYDRQVELDRNKRSVEKAEAYESQIIEGAAGRGDLPLLSDLQADPDLTPQHSNALVRQYDAATKEIRAYEGFAQRFADPNAVFNPFDENDQKGVDRTYRMMGGDMAALKTVVERTGMMPKSAAVGLRGALVSGDVNRVSSALQLAANLNARNPAILSAGVQGSKEIEDAVTTFQHRVEDLGMTAEQAAAKHVESLTPEYQAKVKAKIKNEDLDQIVKKQVSVDDLRAAFDQSWWPGKPAVGVNPEQRGAMYSDYVELFRDNYEKTGDVEQSKALSVKQLRKTWGPSDVTGSTIVTRYPIDRAPIYAGFDDAPKQIADQAVAAIKEQTGQIVTPDKLRFIPLSGGRTSMPYWRGEAPPYRLIWEDDKGVLNELAPGKGFVADPEPMRASKAEALRKRTEQSRARRDFMPGSGGPF